MKILLELVTELSKYLIFKQCRENEFARMVGT